MNSSPIRAASAAAVAVTLIAGLAFAGGPVKLRYKFKQGESLNYTMVMNQDMNITSEAMPGAPQKIDMVMNIDMYQKATKVKADGAQVEVGFTKFDAKMMMGGNEIPIPGMDAMKKLRMSMHMNSRGEMGEPELVNPDEVDATVKQMAQSMKKTMSQNSLVFPEKPLKPGDSWTTEQDLPADLPGAPDLKMKLKGKYTYTGTKKVKGKLCANIRADVKLSLHGKAETNGVPVQADMDGSGSGENLFAIQEGQMVSSTASFNIGGSVVASAGGQKMATKLKMAVKLDMKLK
jgi:hypothetical protein